MFLWFAFAGTQVANIPSGDSANNSTSGGATGFSAIVLLYIAIVFGFSLMVNVWVFFRISGGLFNPAVSSSFHPLDSASYHISSTGYFGNVDDFSHSTRPCRLSIGCTGRR